MDILSRRFDPRIYGTDALIDSAKLFSGQPERKTRIALENANPDEFINHPFAIELEHNSNIEFRKIPDHLHDIIKSNFTVMDKCSYRFEEDKQKAVAIAAFGDTNGFAERLSGYFDNVWEMCEPISVSSFLKDHVSSSH